MAESTTTTPKATGTDPGGPQTMDDVIRVKDLQSGATNPNLPRSLFLSPATGAADVDADAYISVSDSTHVPGKNFKEKSVKAQAIRMNTGFDANGVPGNAGDWLVYAGGHWFVAKDDQI